MKKILLIIFVSFLTLSSLFAQNSRTESNFTSRKNALGFSSNSLSNFGLTYRHHFNDFAIQPNFAFSISDFEEKWEGGVNFLYFLRYDERTALFVYQLNTIQYRKYKNVYDYYPGYYYDNSTSEYLDWTNSAGFGFQLQFGECISLDLMYGLGYYSEFEVFTLSGGFALMYYF
ncbi:MAG: hypothetical protein U9N51_05110 [Bacteroidota bacterium]|nr:hypothetical protein [Bacteroidota bacterium]